MCTVYTCVIWGIPVRRGWLKRCWTSSLCSIHIYIHTYIYTRMYVYVCMYIYMTWYIIRYDIYICVSYLHRMGMSQYYIPLNPKIAEILNMNLSASSWLSHRSSFHELKPNHHQVSNVNIKGYYTAKVEAWPPKSTKVGTFRGNSAISGPYKGGHVPDLSLWIIEISTKRQVRGMFASGAWLLLSHPSGVWGCTRLGAKLFWLLSGVFSNVVGKSPN